MHVHSSVATRRTRLRFGAVIASAAVLTSTIVVGGAISAQASSNISTKPLTILLGVGADETQRNVNWYYPGSAAQSLEFEKLSDMDGGSFDADSTKVVATTALNTAVDTSTTNSDTSGISGITAQAGYYNSHAVMSGLQPDTTYSYRVGASEGTNWSDTYTFTTKSASSDFDFLFFGDPQIGSSGNPDKDAAGWADTLQYATTNTPNAELLVSGGDQVENAANEYEWAAFADSSSILKQYPWGSTIGNHEFGAKAYEQHNFVPNLLKTNDYYQTPASSATQSGGDYWYIWKDVMFIDINSNAYAGGADAEHVNYITHVIDRFGDQAKWKVLVYHHSIYSPADHANDADNQQRRADFTRKFSELGVNLVLQGHDHSYSRSYSILNGKKANADEQPGASEVFAGPGGVIYVTANSASGSKYYDLTAPGTNAAGKPVESSNYGADPLDPTGKRHFANSVENQEHVRTYVKVSVTDDKLEVTDVRAGDCSAPNAAVELGKVTTCGVTLQPTASADPAPVGSTVDHFVLDAESPATSVALSASRSTKVFHTATTVTLTATVGGGIGDVSGDVSFYEGSKLLATKPAVDGVASYTLPSTVTVGSHSYTAKFASDSVFSGADSTSNTTKVSVTKAPSKTSVKFSAGTATVTVTSTGLSVTGTAHLYDGARMIKTISIVKGKGTYKVTLAKGTHKLRAVFVANSTIAASTSATVTVKVLK